MSVHSKMTGPMGAVEALDWGAEVDMPENTDKAELDPATGAGEEAFDFLKLNVRIGSGELVACDAVAGMHLVELMRASGLPIKAECGGAGACGTCHIRLASKWRELVPEALDEEHEKLDEILGADDTSRLACRIVMSDELDGLEFEIQADSLVDQTKGAAG